MPESSTVRCAEAANSPLAEPEWFLDECLGKHLDGQLTAVR